MLENERIDIAAPILPSVINPEVVLACIRADVKGILWMLAGDADVDWVTGWVEGDPWSEHDQGMGGYVRFTNDVDGSPRRMAAGAFRVDEG